MKSKFYIPEREEFHIGFEYYRELIGGEDVGEDNYKRFIWGHEPFKFVNTFPEWLNRDIENCRVKYIDEIDLKELGWESNQVFEFSKEFCKGSNYKLNIYNEIRDGKSMTIYSRVGLEFIPIFTGKIKNKSEFKKLMKQLDVR